MYLLPRCVIIQKTVIYTIKNSCSYFRFGAKTRNAVIKIIPLSLSTYIFFYHHDITEILLKVALNTITHFLLVSENKMVSKIQNCYFDINILFLTILFYVIYLQSHTFSRLRILLAHLAKGNVSFYHHLASIVR